MKIEEIKYRAFIDGKFIYSFTDNGTPRLGWFFANVKSDDYDRWTGLYDSKGTMIWENDILEKYSRTIWIVTWASDDKEALGMQSGFYMQRDDFESFCELCSRCNANGDNYTVLGHFHNGKEYLNGNI